MVLPYNPFGDTSVYLGALQLPHVTSFNPSTEWEQTELPIERGAVISDHRRRRPKTVELTGYVTDQVELVPSGAGVLLTSLAIQSEIERLAETGQTFILRWKGRVWPNMAIIAIGETNDAAAQRDDMWQFSLSLKESRVASSTVVAAGAVDPSVADLTAGPVDGGPQASTAVGPDVAADVVGVLGGGV
jgi:hypothetical protein